MATSQLSFFAAVASFAKPFVPAAAVAADPLTVAKSRFATVADEQLKLLKAKTDKGFWFRAVEGGILVHLKNGAAVLPKCSFQVKDAAAAMKVIEAAKAAAAKGEFDELFKATARKPVVRKPKTPAAAPAAVPSK